MRLEISETLIANILAAAARVYPKECCGLIEGVRTDKGWRALVLHEAKNLASDCTSEFLIDPQVQFRLLRGLRGTGREVIGCYHSHPDGAPAPSAADRASASEDGFFWLIAGCGDEIAAFVYCGGRKEFSPVIMERT